MTSDEEVLSAMQVVLRLEMTVRDYMTTHALVHGTLIAPSLLGQQHAEHERQIRALQLTVASHERTLQRIMGALTFVTALGIGTLLLVMGRIAGIIE